MTIMIAMIASQRCVKVLTLVVVAVTLFNYDVNARCSSSYERCPRSCKCRSKNVVCTGIGLDQVPTNLSADIEVLRLAKNKIHNLTADDLAGCRQLLTLDLYGNLLVDIDRKAFADTLSLISVNLQYNRLVIGRLANDTFSGLVNLSELLLNENNWRGDRQYNGKLLSGLRNLRTLAIDALPNQTFPREFSQLTRLQNLTITGKLVEITNDSFQVFSKSQVKNLYIRTDNYLRSSQPLSFSHFQLLESLSLNYNRNLGFKAAAKAWYGLQYTRIKLLYLKAITPSNETSNFITKDFFNFLNLTNITKLYLTDNNLVFIEPLFSKSLPKLTRLSLVRNRLNSQLGLLGDLAKLQYLSDLQLEYQNCPTIPRPELPPASEDYSGQSSGDLSTDHESLQDFYTAKCKTYEHVECESIDNRWTTTSDSVKQLGKGGSMDALCIPLAPHLQNLSLISGLFVDENALPPVKITTGGGKLRRIFLGSNGLRTINGPFILSEPVQKLRLQLEHNAIECLHPDVFKISTENGTKLTELVLLGNNLGPQLQHDSNGDTFKHLPFLYFLNLNYNNIKRLHANIFHSLKNMEVLTMAGNMLRTIDFEFLHMRRLEVLDLSYNDLTTLNANLTNKFTNIIDSNQRNKTFVLDLSGNPLQCACDTLSFLQWIDTNRNYMQNLNATSCLFEEKIVSFSKLHDYILVELRFACSKQTALIVAGILLGLTLILVTISAICYRHRWEIRYACIRLTRRGLQYQQLIDEAVQYDYDAFVVYDSRDGKWVREELVPHLERTATPNRDGDESELGDLRSNSRLAELRLCVHERDFVPGEDILGNIWKRMERSRKVILVISETFAMSHYCDYEMNLARMQSVEVGRNVIVPILLAIPDVEKISDCLYWVLRKVTYLEWPRYEDDRDDFWRKLRQTVLGDDNDNSIRIRAA